MTIWQAYFKVKVFPGARRQRIIPRGNDAFDIHVREPAEAGRANNAMLALLAEELRVPIGQLWILKGAHTRSKIIAQRP